MPRISSIEIPRPYRAADEIDDDPPGNDGADLVDVARRRQLDEVEAEHPALAEQPLDEVERLHEGDAARAGRRDRRDDRGIETVGVDRDVIAAVIGDAFQDRLGAVAVQLARGDDVGAVALRRLDLLAPRAALG